MVWFTSSKHTIKILVSMVAIIDIAIVVKLVMRINDIRFVMALLLFCIESLSLVKNCVLRTLFYEYFNIPLVHR